MIRLVGLGYLLLEQVYAVLQRRDVLGGGERLVQDAAPAHLDGLLLQVAHYGVLGEGDAALIGVLAPRDDLEQRGLARPVGPYQRHPVASGRRACIRP